MKQNENSRISMPPEVREAFEQDPGTSTAEFERVWELIDIPQAEKTVTPPDAMDQRWVELQQRMKGASSPGPGVRAKDRRPSRNSRRVLFKRSWAVLAVFLVAILAGNFIYWRMPISITAPYGQTAGLRLPDGSLIELNSGSTLRYRRGFDGIPFVEAAERRVHLHGEAYFTVTRSATPFSVSTFNAEIQVLGTQFNVKAWPELNHHMTSVALASGRVQVTSMAPTSNGVILDEPGEVVYVASDQPNPSEPVADNLDRILGWRDNRFAVNNESLQSVFAELELRYGVDISVDDSTILRDSLAIILGTPGGIEAILDDICTMKSLRYRATSRGYQIFR